ncbi:TPA: hypothetical protein DCW38_07530 [candidate division WOR-3 bacterium]|uniref:Uncharacterized protein n=1 Tax=candidate division WOR-3 bacterium TaxID=2052148 RepID=A0A350HBU4_UNCW3|nr:hypothetical protein [candidate division WOR-3 bacterium]
MKKSLIAVTLILISLLIFSMETGKLNDIPSSVKSSLQLSSGIAAGKDFVIPGFKAQTILKNTDYPIYSMTEHNSRLLAGCGDAGRIIDISSGADIASFSEGEIVYSLLSVDKTTLFASIQPSGIIVRLTDKKIDTIFSFPDKSVNLLKKIGNTVYTAVGNELFAYKNGGFEKIVKVNDRNILYFEEIDGYIYISTEGAGKVIKYSIKENSQEVVFSLSSGEIQMFKKAGGRLIIAANMTLPMGDGTESFCGILLSVENSAIDTIAREDFPYSVSISAFDGILLGASVPGRCYYYDLKNYFYLGSLENDFIMSLYECEKCAYIGTAKSNSIIKLSGGDKPSDFLSSVIDAQKDVSITAFFPLTKKNGKFFVRTGDTYSIDSFWSGFMIVKPQMNESMSPSRYLQYRYSFNGSDDTLYNVSMFYKTKNHSPKFKSINIYPERIIPDYANTPEWEGEILYKRSFYPEIKDVNIYKSKRNIKFVIWNCFDIDQDKLDYDVYLISGENAFLAAKNISASYFVINLESFKEGYYKVKVTASDSSDNNDPLSAEIVSGEFYIDRTPCEFSDDIFEKNVLKFRVNDNSSLIDEVSYSVNGSIFKRVIPADGIYDSKSELFEIMIEREKNQSLSIVVKGTDSSGNSSIFSKVVK